MIDLNQYKLELDYPCEWKYKVVIKSDKNIENIIKDILLNKEYTLKPSKVSSKGNFKSYTIEMLVYNENERKEIYSMLGKHKDIKMVV